MENDNKQRPFYVYKLLNELTDENHELTTNEIVDLLWEKYTIIGTIFQLIILFFQFSSNTSRVIDSGCSSYSIASNAFVYDAAVLLSAVPVGASGQLSSAFSSFSAAAFPSPVCRKIVS